MPTLAVTSSVGSPLLWGGFLLFVLVMLALDLGVFHREAHAIGAREAALWSGVWVALAVIFGLGLWWRFGSGTATRYFTGYVVEKSLSIDNVFVFVLIFASLAIPRALQHRVLFWGVLSALVLRAGMIFGGVALLERFHWLVYLFGGFLVVTGVRLLASWRSHEQEMPGRRLLALAKRVLPTTEALDGAHFFTRQNGRRLATPLLVALVLVEGSDVVFALDSVPAIFAVTTDPFLVFTSNVFAILGLRSLFFLLADVVERFRYLKLGLAAVLVYVGLKMVLASFVTVPPALSLAIIVVLLGAAVLASWWRE